MMDRSSACAPSTPPFFRRLPPELRGMVYAHLFAGARVHLFPTMGTHASPSPRWRHKLCACRRGAGRRGEFAPPGCGGIWSAHQKQQTRRRSGEAADEEEEEEEEEEDGAYDGCYIDDFFDCPYATDNAHLASVAWLRTCRLAYKDALPHLYAANTFVLDASAGDLDRLRASWPRHHTRLLSSIDLLSYMPSITVTDAATDAAWDDDAQNPYCQLGRALDTSPDALPGLRTVRIMLHDGLDDWSDSLQEQGQQGQQGGQQQSVAEAAEATATQILASLSPAAQHRWIRPFEDLGARLAAAGRRLDVLVPACWTAPLRALLARRGKFLAGAWVAAPPASPASNTISAATGPTAATTTIITIPPPEMPTTVDPFPPLPLIQKRHHVRLDSYRPRPLIADMVAVSGPCALAAAEEGGMVASRDENNRDGASGSNNSDGSNGGSGTVAADGAGVVPLVGVAAGGGSAVMIR